ncbi:hypothetical protein [Pseudomonas sp. Marseille-Q5115]|uniref:hypothetical protein n=1 Tax=Pseudomonas sp. Marseille-Q5115 TaxID=2866593 RepID=UPI001CE41DF2|nr:hypothetical protein [Pseudomonas sp. Marseille-Q5115]
MSKREQQDPEKLLEWMKAHDHTWGCSAVVAYDKLKTNQLLFQEYVERFDGDPMPATSGHFDSDQDEYTWLGGVEFYAPKLSFEDSVWSSSSARLTLKAASGVQVNLERDTYSEELDPKSHYPAVKIRYMSPLNGLDQYTRVPLDRWVGGVEGGKVTISLQNTRDIEESRFTVSPAKEVQHRAAAAMDRVFKAMEPELTTFELNTLKSDPNAFFTPTDFNIRIHALSETGTGTSSVSGDGAVVLFIKADEDDTASFPPDAPGAYLLPSGYSATMALGRAFMLRRILQQGLATLAEPGYSIMQLLDADNQFSGMKFRQGRLKSERFSIPVVKGEDEVILSGSTPALELGLSAEDDSLSAPLTIQFATRENSIFADLKWSNKQKFSCSINGMETDVDFQWAYEWSYQLTFENNDIKLVLVDNRSAVKPLQRALVGLEKHPLLNEIVNAIENELFIGKVLPLVDDALSMPVGYLNAMRLNQLLFRGENPVELESMHLPRGVVLFGHVSPARTRFYINVSNASGESVEHIQAKGKVSVEIALTDIAELATVSWSVEGVLYDEDVGHFDDPGAINTNYSAPETLVGENFITVRIKAEVTFKGDERVYASLTLVNVYSSGIMLGPVVQVMEKAKLRYLSVTSVSDTASVEGHMMGDQEVIGEVLKRSDIADFPWQYTAPTGSKLWDEDEEGVEKKPKGFDLRQANFIDNLGNTTYAYFLVRYLAPSIALVVEKKPNVDGLCALSIRAYAKDNGEELVFDRWKPHWNHCLGEGNLRVLENGSAEYVYRADIPQQFVVVVMKIRDSEIPKGRAKLRRIPARKIGDGAEPDYYGTVLIPLPWVDIPEPGTSGKDAQPFFKLTDSPRKIAASGPHAAQGSGGR